jgi:diguanylate cyclase (GGDEF)-like protein/PAS domain S-box-containing protein
LTALRDVSRLVLDSEASVESTLERIAEILPLAFQYPEVAAARILYRDTVFTSPGFRESQWRLEHRFECVSAVPVTMEVYYTEARRDAAVGPFLAEEVSLLATIADILRSYLDRREAERLALQSADRFSRAFHGSPVPTSLVRLKDRVLLDCNDAALEMMGYVREEIVGRDARPFNHWADPEEGEAFVEQMATQRYVRNARHTLRTRDGVERAIIGSAQIIEIDGEDCILSTFYDVTDALQAEQALNETQQLWQSLIANTSDIVTLLDTSGRVILASPSIEVVMGYTLDEYIGRSAFEFIHPEDISRPVGLFQTAVSGEVTEQHTVEFRYRHKDGSWRILDAAGAELKDAERGVTGLIVVARDITERKEMENRIGFQARILDTVAQSVVATDNRGIITYANHHAEEIFGWSREEMIGRPVHEITPSNGPPGLVEQVLEHLRAGLVWSGELDFQRRDGSWFPADAITSGVRNENGELIGAIGIAIDISERKRAEEQITYLAYHDALTSLPNRRLLADRFEVALAQARRGEEALCVMSVDVDRFKNVNDTLGHGAGDELLTATAQRLRSVIRDGDTIARVGGDEFIILLPRCSDPAEPAQIAARIVQGFNAPFVIGGSEYHASVSLGLSMYPADGLDAESLTRAADAAMYAAKEAGRDCFRVYEPTMLQRGAEWLTLESELRRALQRGEIEPFFQPQVSIATGRIVGAEALARWNHPQRGLVPPAEFIPLAEETGLISQLGEQILERACAEAAAWEDPIRVAVNVSLRQFYQSGFGETVARILEKTGLEAQRLDLEITESMAHKDIDTARAVANSLRSVGVRLSVDDFGIGNTSLQYLPDFPVQSLKIDQGFIRDLLTKPGNAAIAGGVIALGHRLGLIVLAEGVESSEQLEFLRQHACDEYQGYLCSKPLPAHELRTLLAKQFWVDGAITR